MSVNILTLSKKYNTQAKCLSLLEKIRWGKTVTCPYCESSKTKTAKNEAGRHSCRNCKRTFSVFIDTIFEGTRLPLPKWFMIIGTVLNAKSGMAAKEIQRNYGVTYKTAYYVAMRLRIGMLMQNTELHGILEMDESYFGGKTRKKNSRENKPNVARVYLKRGRGTSKISVAGIVERGGDVKTKVLEKKLRLADLADVEEVFLANAIQGIRWVREINQCSNGLNFNLAQQLVERLNQHFSTHNIKS